MVHKNQNELNRSGFENIWTTDINEFILVENMDNDGYGIVRIFPNGVISSLIIENNAVYLALQKKLLDADARIMTYSEFMGYKSSRG